MSLSRPKRFARIAAVLLLVCAYAINAGAWGVELFASLEKTPVEASAIAVPEGLATCPHHPQGCPKDCLCPKTHVLEASPVHDQASSGALSGLALVNCTEGGAADAPSVFAVFIPEATWELPPLRSTSLPLPERNVSIARGFSEPSQKVPIA